MMADEFSDFTRAFFQFNKPEDRALTSSVPCGVKREYKYKCKACGKEVSSLVELSEGEDVIHANCISEKITPRSKLLNEAMKITHHDRNANYGNPEDNFKHIAKLWTAYLQVGLEARMQGKLIKDFAFSSVDVAIMNMLIKVARLGNNPAHHDSAVDIAGYAACLADIQESLSGVAQPGSVSPAK